MVTLNTVTQRMDGTNFNTYRLNDLVRSVKEMTKNETDGLKARLELLENTEELDVAADGFGEDFSGMDLFDERSILRSILKLG